MRALARLESFIQDLVERPAWLLTQRRLHPLDMAAALTRAMEADALPLADRVLAPDGYALRLSPQDYEQFAGVRRTLEREYGEYLTRLAMERGLTLAAPATVTLAAARDLRPGSLDVATRFSEVEEPRPAPSTRDGHAHLPAPAATQVVRAPRPPAPASGAVLEIVDRAGAVERRHALDENGVVIGRRSSSGLSLTDPEVSRRHAQIEYRGGQYYLLDLGSMNGTLVNGRLIDEPHPLADGDTIVVGHSRLRFRRGG